MLDTTIDTAKDVALQLALLVQALTHVLLCVHVSEEGADITIEIIAVVQEIIEAVMVCSADDALGRDATLGISITPVTHVHV